MATRTIVCPECQAPAAPGRYACAHCGALLASVALAPRAYQRGGREATVDVAPPEARPELGARSAVTFAPQLAEQLGNGALVAERPRRTSVAPAWTQGLAAEPLESAPGADERWDDQPPIADVAPAKWQMEGNSGGDDQVSVQSVAATVNGATEPSPKRAVEKKAPPTAAIKPAPVPKARRRSTPDPAALARIAPLVAQQPDAEPAPLAAAEAAPDIAPEPTAPSVPVVATAAPEPAPLAVTPPAVAPLVERTPTVEPAPRVQRTPRYQPTPRYQLAPAPEHASRVVPAPRIESPPPVEPAPRIEPASRREAVPAWPPPGDRGPLVEPLPRVPAGVYLPPSAVLPSGEALPVGGVSNGRAASVAVAPAATASGETSERVSAADRLAQLGLPADTSRRVVAIGAVVAALGFLLPWSASPTGNDLLGDYWVRWGMAGPAAWIVVALLIGLAGLTLAGGRFAAAPVGLPGFALAMFVFGLSWPYLFGLPGLTVGIWVVLAGVILLAVGGLLDMRTGRHDGPQPSV